MSLCANCRKTSQHAARAFGVNVVQPARPIGGGIVKAFAYLTREQASTPSVPRLLQQGRRVLPRGPVLPRSRSSTSSGVTMFNSTHARKGFTLIELLIVVVIIGI